MILIIVIAVLLAASGVLAMAETSLVRMNRIKAKSLVDENKRGARQLARLVENPANFLNPVLLLVLICQLVSATLVGIVAADLFGGLGVLFGIVFEIVVIFVFFEAVPKNWAVQNSERAALFERADRERADPLPAHPVDLGPAHRARQSDHRRQR